jgi:hypothetical protein
MGGAAASSIHVADRSAIRLTGVVILRYDDTGTGRGQLLVAARPGRDIEASFWGDPSLPPRPRLRDPHGHTSDRQERPGGGLLTAWLRSKADKPPANLPGRARSAGLAHSARGGDL